MEEEKKKSIFDKMDQDIHWGGGSAAVPVILIAGAYIGAVVLLWMSAGKQVGFVSIFALGYLLYFFRSALMNFIIATGWLVDKLITVVVVIGICWVLYLGGKLFLGWFLN